MSEAKAYRCDVCELIGTPVKSHHSVLDLAGWIVVYGLPGGAVHFCSPACCSTYMRPPVGSMADGHEFYLENGV